MIAIYVDDILIACRDSRKISCLGEALAEEFNIKDLGQASYCLGIEFSQGDGEIGLNQQGYVKELFRRFGMPESKL